LHSVSINPNKVHLKSKQLSIVSKISSRFSISSSPNINFLIQEQPTAPSENRLSFVSKISSFISIPSSPNTIPTIEQQPTAPLESLLKHGNDNRNFENEQIKPIQDHNFGDNI